MRPKTCTGVELAQVVEEFGGFGCVDIQEVGTVSARYDAVHSDCFTVFIVFPRG